MANVLISGIFEVQFILKVGKYSENGFQITYAYGRKKSRMHMPAILMDTDQ